MERHTRLEWPLGWKRTASPRAAPFDLSLDRSIASLRDEIRLLGGKEARLTHNSFRSGAEPRDAGVAVYFDLKGARKVFASDRWSRVRDNVRAIAKTIEALRGMERWGASDMLERAFTGFDALPPPASCWSILGLAPGASADKVSAAYRDKAKRAHPDHGGTEAAMAELNRARDEAMGKV